MPILLRFCCSPSTSTTVLDSQNPPFSPQTRNHHPPPTAPSSATSGELGHSGHPPWYSTSGRIPSFAVQVPSDSHPHLKAKRPAELTHSHLMPSLSRDAIRHLKLLRGFPLPHSTQHGSSFSRLTSYRTVSFTQPWRALKSTTAWANHPSSHFIDLRLGRQKNC